jgi:hypothetical protein
MRENNTRSLDHFPVEFSQAVERRESERLGCLLLVDYAVADFVYRDFVRDISCDGMFIETRRKFGKGLILHIAFNVLGQGGIKLTGRVARSTREGIGVKFETPLTEAQLKSLLLSWA